MSYQRINMPSFAIRYGLIVAVGCIIYFLIMRLLKLHFMVELSLLNGVVMIIGIYFAIRNFKKANNGSIKYLEGLGLGFLTAVVASVVFGIFMVLFALFVNDSFLTETNANESFGKDLSLVTMFGYVVIELIISGFIAGFVFMQLFKNPDHKLTN